LFPDGDTKSVFFMTNWTPHFSNRMGLPPAPLWRALRLHEDGTFALILDAIPGRTYRIETKSDLSAPGWTAWGTNIMATNDWITILDNSDGLDRRFYRARLLQ